MFRFDAKLKVYVHREAVDFRKSINGLAALVEQALGLDPFAAALYVFGNRRRNRVKILGWETNGSLPPRARRAAPSKRTCSSTKPSNWRPARRPAKR